MAKPKFSFTELKTIEVVELHPTEIDGEPNTSLDYDYYGAIVEVNGQEIVRFGDAYHEKGRDQAEGFAKGVIAAFKGLGLPAPRTFKSSSRLDESVNVV